MADCLCESVEGNAKVVQDEDSPMPCGRFSVEDVSNCAKEKNKGDTDGDDKKGPRFDQIDRL